MQDGMVGGESYIAVDVRSLAGAGSVVKRLGTSLDGATGEAQRQVARHVTRGVRETAR